MLEAMALLEDDCRRASLAARRQPRAADARSSRTNSPRCSEELRDRVTFRGPYDHAELPTLMADLHWVVVPSIWWENSPLVIQEAFFHRRPIICSDVGGMAEKVRDGVDGIHFRVGDSFSLARTIEKATSSPELWSELRAGIEPPYAMDVHVAKLLALYRKPARQPEGVGAGG